MIELFETPEQLQTLHHHPNTNNNSCSTIDSNLSSSITREVHIDAKRYKTKMCRNYLRLGYCPYEIRCMFAHGPHELRTAEENNRDGLTTEAAIKHHQRVVKQALRHEAALRRGYQPSSLTRTSSTSPTVLHHANYATAADGSALEKCDCSECHSQYVPQYTTTSSAIPSSTSPSPLPHSERRNHVGLELTHGHCHDCVRLQQQQQQEPLGYLSSHSHETKAPFESPPPQPRRFVRVSPTSVN